MNEPAALRPTLRLVAAAMAECDKPWWIIGSAAAVLHGAAIDDVGDVDVVLDADDAARLLPRLGGVGRDGAAHPDFRSKMFATWRDPPLAVEFMAGFHHRRVGIWEPVRLATRQAFNIGGTIVFAPERDELRRLMTSFGRPKDVVRARLLAALG